MGDKKKDYTIKPVKKIPSDLSGSKEIPIKVKSYAGYASTKKGSHLFTWFFGCKKMSDEKDAAAFPLLIWLNGGPGGSSMAGEMLENGPYMMDKKGAIYENPHAWNQEAHIMYWDNPVGAGYSYNENGKYVNNENQLSEQFYEALQDFYDSMPPQYRECDLYVTGESYGGKYIPAITEKIMEKNDKNREKGKPGRIINVKGMAIGNPWMDPVMQCKFRLEKGFAMGFLGRKQYEILMESYELLPKLIENKQWRAAFELNQNLKNQLTHCGGGIAIYDTRIWDDGLLGEGLKPYFNLPETRAALNVPDRPWVTADETGPVTEHLIKDFMTDTAEYNPDANFDFSLPRLLDREDEEHDPALRVMLYTGNMDMSCGILGTEYILQNCKWRYQEEWRKLAREVWGEKKGDPDKKTKGFIKQYKNLTQVVIPRSGHLVPMDRPVVSLDMINNYVFQRDFPSYDPLMDED